MLTGLHLRNFKCFGQRESTVCSTLTLMTGLNGMGKSSVIPSFACLAAIFRDS